MMMIIISVIVFFNIITILIYNHYQYSNIKTTSQNEIELVTKIKTKKTLEV